MGKLLTQVLRLMDMGHHPGAEAAGVGVAEGVNLRVAIETRATAERSLLTATEGNQPTTVTHLLLKPPQVMVHQPPIAMAVLARQIMELQPLKQLQRAQVMELLPTLVMEHLHHKQLRQVKYIFFFP